MTTDVSPPVPASRDYPLDEVVVIESQGTWPRTVHQFDAAAILALKAAEVTGRPLLLRGDPGTGKSQTARAAAAVKQRPFVPFVIDGRTEPHDLMWRFDAVGRLADAQVKNRVQEECAYLVPQALWWAYGWANASQWLATINDNRRRKLEAPAQAPASWQADQDRVVLLIDEIDKADPELPNALLEVLANLGFREPYGGNEVRCSEATRPLVIITTNEERQLPPAFLRRCLVHRLNLPEDDEELVQHLTRIGQQHQQHLRPTQPCLVLEKAARHVVRERGRLADAGLYLPGTSEFLDLIAAAARLGGPDPERQRMLLDDLVPYTLRKSQQDR